MHLEEIQGRVTRMEATCSDQLNELQSLLLHPPLPAGVQVFSGGLFGFDRQRGDPSDRGGGAELCGQGGGLWTSQVTHLTHRSGRVVEISAELTHPLGPETERGRQSLLQIVSPIYKSPQSYYTGQVTFTVTVSAKEYKQITINQVSQRQNSMPCAAAHCI